MTDISNMDIDELRKALEEKEKEETLEYTSFDKTKYNIVSECTTDENGKSHGDRKGFYRVKWTTSGNSGPGRLSLEQIHSDSPQISNEKVFTGSLCSHEIEYLSGVGGFDFSPYWKFEIFLAKENN